MSSSVTEPYRLMWQAPWGGGGDRPDRRRSRSSVGRRCTRRSRRTRAPPLRGWHPPRTGTADRATPRRPRSTSQKACMPPWRPNGSATPSSGPATSRRATSTCQSRPWSREPPLKRDPGRSDQCPNTWDPSGDEDSSGGADHRGADRARSCASTAATDSTAADVRSRRRICIQSVRLRAPRGLSARRCSWQDHASRPSPPPHRHPSRGDAGIPRTASG